MKFPCYFLIFLALLVVFFYILEDYTISSYPILL